MQYNLDSEIEIQRVSKLILCLSSSDDWVVSIDPRKRKRSNPQNRLYWAWVRILSRHFGYSDEELHEILKAKFLGVETTTFGGETYTIPRSSKRLSKEDFTSYLEKVMALGMQEGINLPT